MEWKEIIAMVCDTLVKLIVAFVLPYVFSLLAKSIKNRSILEMIELAKKTCIDCVLVVDQIFVDELKKNGAFTKEEQIKAFNMCKERILDTLTDSAKEAVIQLNGDLDTWIETQVESYIKTRKSAIANAS